jgi:hypothetical protein
VMHGHEKSDSAIVATKLPNKAGKPAAEAVERRAGLPTIYQGAFWVFSEGSNRVPALSMAQATLRRRSATDRKARPWL